MKIKTEQGITGPVAYEIRTKARLTQRQFWGAIGISQARGSRFESETTQRITKSIRMLVFARYVAGLELDASTAESAARLVRLAQVQVSMRTPAQTISQ